MGSVNVGTCDQPYLLDEICTQIQNRMFKSFDKYNNTHVSRIIIIIITIIIITKIFILEKKKKKV